MPGAAHCAGAVTVWFGMALAVVTPEAAVGEPVRPSKIASASPNRSTGWANAWRRRSSHDPLCNGSAMLVLLAPHCPQSRRRPTLASLAGTEHMPALNQVHQQLGVAFRLIELGWHSKRARRRIRADVRH